MLFRSLLLSHMDTARLEREIQQRNLEQYSYMREAEKDIQINPNPLTQQ